MRNETPHRKNFKRLMVNIPSTTDHVQWIQMSAAKDNISVGEWVRRLVEPAAEKAMRKWIKDGSIS